VVLALAGCADKSVPVKDQGNLVPVSGVFKATSLATAKNAIYGACTKTAYKVVSTTMPIICAKNKIEFNREVQIERAIGTQIQRELMNEFSSNPTQFISFELKQNDADVEATATAYATVPYVNDSVRRLNLGDEVAIAEMKQVLQAAGAQ